MVYTDAFYHSRYVVGPINIAPGTQTYTASGHAVTNTTIGSINYLAPRRLSVVSARCNSRTIPAGPLTATVRLMEGTNTVATVTTGTAGATGAMTVTAANATIASASVLDFDFASTGTASENVDGGSFDIYIEFLELFNE